MLCSNLFTSIINPYNFALSCNFITHSLLYFLGNGNSDWLKRTRVVQVSYGRFLSVSITRFLDRIDGNGRVRNISH